MDPRDELPLAHRAHTEVDAQCDKLHGQARQPNVNRCKYCQLSSNDDPAYSFQFCRLKLTTHCDDRRAVAKLLKSRGKYP